ncbi:MAG: DUF4115 domain-containing protein [Candidatus Aminicenantes bacterium]|nr:DUF4115 domain-containing protein [Candidatus Aminicenantes bacterium]
MTEIGEILKNERNNKNISLKQVSRKTNINTRFLKALEDGDWHLIRGDFYIKNYIKNYLEAIAVDVDEFFEINKNRLIFPNNENEEPANSFVPKLRYARFKRKKKTIIVLLFVILAAAAAAFLDFKKAGFIPGFLDFSKVNFPATGIGIGPLNKPFSPDRSPVNVKIDFLDTCWTQVWRSKRQVFEKTFEKDEKFEISGYEFVFFIGNPAAVRFFLNGEEVSYLKNLMKPQRIFINPLNLEAMLKK